MNKVILLGRLTRDPEIRYSQGANSLAIASYSLAVNRSYKRDGEPDSDFFNCTAFGKNAEFAEKYLKKGTKIALVGKIQNESYTNKEGQKVTATKIIVDEQEFAESKNASSGESGGYQPSARPTPSAAVGDGFMNIPDGIDEELPFN